MLSPKRRKHGRPAGTSTPSAGDALAFTGHSTSDHSRKGSTEPRLVKQMAKTIRPRRRFGTPQSLAATSAHAPGVRAARGAADRPNAPPFHQTDSRLDGCPGDPA